MNGILRCNNNDTCRFALYCDEFAAHRWAGPTLQLIPAESNRLSANGRLFYSFPAVPVEYLALFLFVSDAIVSTCLMAFFFLCRAICGPIEWISPTGGRPFFHIFFKTDAERICGIPAGTYPLQPLMEGENSFLFFLFWASPINGRPTSFLSLSPESTFKLNFSGKRILSWWKRVIWKIPVGQVNGDCQPASRWPEFFFFTGEFRRITSSGGVAFEYFLVGHKEDGTGKITKK